MLGYVRRDQTSYSHIPIGICEIKANPVDSLAMVKEDIWVMQQTGPGPGHKDPKCLHCNELGYTSAVDICSNCSILNLTIFSRVTGHPCSMIIAILYKNKPINQWKALKFYFYFYFCSLLSHELKRILILNSFTPTQTPRIRKAPTDFYKYFLCNIAIVWTKYKIYWTINILHLHYCYHQISLETLDWRQWGIM